MQTLPAFSTVAPRPRRRLRLLTVAALLAGGMTVAGATSGLLLTSPAAASAHYGCGIPSTDPTFSIGDGSVGTPYIVTNSAQLALLDVTGSAMNGHYRQECNLDLSAYTNWAGVGGPSSAAFQGVYDGGGYTISNVSIAASGNNWGLFRNANGATIKNLTLTGVTISVTTGGQVGSLIGNADNVTVSAVTVSAASVTGGFDIGGLIGKLLAQATSSAHVIDSHATGNVTGTGNQVGGLIGEVVANDEAEIVIQGSRASGIVTGVDSVGGLIGTIVGSGQPVIEVSGSRATGNVTSTGSSSWYGGGLIGVLEANGATRVLVSETFATGNVTATNGVGGLIGGAYFPIDYFATAGAEIVIEDSFTTGHIEGRANVGGLIGYADAYSVAGRIRSLNVTASFATGDVSGSHNYVGGLIGYAFSDGIGELSVSDSYATGDVSGSANYVGGLIGFGEVGTGGGTVTVASSYAIGAVTGTGSDVGGLIGKVTDTVTVSASFWDINTSGVTESAGGGGAVGKTTAQMQLFATFSGAGWSITQFDANPSAIWGICDGSSYPYLRWESQRPSCAPSTINQVIVLPPPDFLTRPATAPSTSAPPATTPPTTAAPTDPTAPVFIDGATPELPPGEATVYDNGQPVTVERFVENQTDLVVRSADFELRITGGCLNACPIQTTSDGRLVLTLEERGSANVNGLGFQPGSTVYVWLFSEPTFLGQLTVNGDGTFAGQVALGDVAAGEHTLQVNGTGANGGARTANLGVLVTLQQAPNPGSGVMPRTGSNITPIWLVALALLGLGLVATSRRRRIDRH